MHLEPAGEGARVQGQGAQAVLNLRASMGDFYLTHVPGRLAITRY